MHVWNPSIPNSCRVFTKCNTMDRFGQPLQQVSAINGNDMIAPVGVVKRKTTSELLLLQAISRTKSALLGVCHSTPQVKDERLGKAEDTEIRVADSDCKLARVFNAISNLPDCMSC